MRRMAGMVDYATWKKRIAALRRQLETYPFWETFLLKRHGLEVAFGEAHDHFLASGRYPWPSSTAEQYRLYAFIAMAVQVHAKLSLQGQTRLEGAIRSGLKREFGLGPIAFELRIAAHLMSRGFDVCFSDLETGGGHDFLAISGATHIEVECKHVSADIGRQIHRQDHYHLNQSLSSVVSRYMDEVGGGRLVRVTIPGRLTSEVGQQRAIADGIEKILFNSSDRIENDQCTVSAQLFDITTSPFSRNHGHQLAEPDVKKYAKEAFGIDNANVLVAWRPGRAAVLVVTESATPDKVVGEIFKHLNGDAKRQFSKSLPAILCVHLADLSGAELQDIADTEHNGTVTGLQRAASLLLNKRPHLHTVAFFTDGDVRMKREQSELNIHTSVNEAGRYYFFTNPNHPAVGLPMLDELFRSPVSV